MSLNFLKYSVLGLIVLLATVLQAQQWTGVIDAPPNALFYPTPPGSTFGGEDVQPTSDGGYLVAGIESLATGAVRDFPVVSKANAQGYLEWQRHYFRPGGAASVGYFNHVALLVGAGDTALIAATGSYTNAVLMLTQITAQGDSIWQRNFLSNCGCQAEQLSMVMTANGDYLVAVATRPLTGGNGQTLLLQINSQGTVVQQTTQASFGAESIIKNFDGEYIVAGSFNNTPALRKLDAQLAIQWTNTYTSVPTSGLHSVAQTADSGYVAATELQGFIGPTPQLFKVDAAGQAVEWTLDTLATLVGIGLRGNSYDVIPTATGNLMYVVDLEDSRSVMPIFGFKALVAEISPTGEILDYTLLDPGLVIATKLKRIRPVGIHEFILVGSYANYRGYLVKLGQAGTQPQQLRGHLYVDTNNNCVLDLTEQRLRNWIVQAEHIQTGQLYYASTDYNGYYQINLPAGTYSVEGYAPNNIWSPCNTAIALTATRGGIDTLDFGFATTFSCPQLTVDVSTAYVQACDTLVYTVSYCNHGNAPAQQTLITLAIDTFTTWLGATLPTTVLSQAGWYQINVGNLGSGQCGTFEFRLATSCPLPPNYPICVQADIEPDTLCGSQFLGWDGSDIEVRGTCTVDSILYWLYNRGIGNMSTSRTYLVTEDHIMLRTGNYQLGAGDSVRIAIAIRSNSIYYIQAEQHPMHPYRAYASGGIADCSGITTGTINGISFSPYPEDDAAPTRSIDCQLGWNNDSSNYKRVSPVGFGSLHWIEQGVDLEYHLRFQNTTGSWLQQVILVDTLDANLDPTTLVMGASSHLYTWSLSATGVLRVELTNILLDTMAWGFVKFRIAQQPNLSLGTIINNSASISLGGYELSSTNTTFHTIADDFIPNNIIKHPKDVLEWLVYPNPFTTMVTFAPNKGLVAAFEVGIYDALGRKVGQVQSINGQAVQWQANGLTAGVYVYEILMEGIRVGTGKLVMGPK